MANTVSYTHTEPEYGVKLSVGVVPGSFCINEGDPGVQIAAIFAGEKLAPCIEAAVAAFNKAYQAEFQRMSVHPVLEAHAEAAE